MELIKQFTEEQYANALESWDWLDLGGKAPRFTSLFGDMFLEAVDGGWWYLDTLEGALSRPWNSGPEMFAELATEDGQDKYLLGPLAMAAHYRRGLRLEAGQIYAWAPPPMFTGSFAVDDIAVFAFVAVVNIAGQMHGPARD